jgi:hypothetical protein
LRQIKWCTKPAIKTREITARRRLQPLALGGFPAATLLFDAPPGKGRRDTAYLLGRRKPWARVLDRGESIEWQDWLVDESSSQEENLVASQEAEHRHKALIDSLSVLNARERRIFEARPLADEPSTLEELAREFGVSRERIRPD